MQEKEKEAIAAICLMAAMADGGKSDVEHAQLREIFQSVGLESSAAVVQRVVLRKTTPADEAGALSSPEMRMFAFEMAVCICDADGATTPREKEFLDNLKGVLGIPSPEAAEIQSQAEDFAMAASAMPPVPVVESASLPQPLQPDKPVPEDAEIDQTILNQAILLAGLELLPKSLSTLAILPLQMRLVYTIGARYGYQLDSGHVKEFLAVLGVGMTSQIVEDMARKFLGSLARKAGGRMMGGMAGTATGATITFATTYGLGMAAKKYYASGRKLSMDDVKNLFRQSAEEAKGLYARYAGQVEQSAKSTHTMDLLAMVRGK
ncbi:MAG TPA: TerB family tellurite resistance protein [Candidatus Hydrogenedentes bacterium]|nr:TerB family tellurite resistance protein [Candidatus Hydrogenedentota bacterium]